LADAREVTIQQYKTWLEEFRWNWYATLKLTSGAPTDRRAERLFGQWIEELGKAEGTSRFRWFRVLERGFAGDNPHFHVLIGGLRNRNRYWEKKWSDLGGNALITPFDPTQKGILYMLKSVDENGDIDCDFKLPRRRKARTGRSENLR
jgi:hypothetical protein